MLIATFLPYISASVLGITSSVSLFGYWEGKVTLFVIFANILFVFKDYVKKYVPQLFEKGIGFYVMLLGIASMIAYAILYKEPEQVAKVSNTTIVDAPTPAPTDAAQPVAPTSVVPTAEPAAPVTGPAQTAIDTNKNVQ